MLIISHPDQYPLATTLSNTHHIPIATIDCRKFPDGETYLRLRTPVHGKKIFLIASLNQPDDKLVWLYLLTQTLRTEGVTSIHLIAPYLGYMRQDTQFNPGESITSKHIASLLSHAVDELTTIDPHLHRYTSLSEIYTIPTTVQHAAPLIAQWIQAHIQTPLLIGPDSESAQWTSDLATRLDVPYTILEKKRLGDHDVEISIPDVHRYTHHTPILIDDIISTAHTMIETIAHLKHTPLRPPICIGIHAVFAQDAYDRLAQSGCTQIITTNTIPHPTNQIDISSLLIQ